MKFTVNREQFKKILGVVKLAQGSNGNNEWVKGIKFQTEGIDTIRLTASDTTTTISTVIDNVKIEDVGSMLLNGDTIDKLMSAYTDNEVEFELEDKYVKINTGKNKGQFEVMEEDNFVGIDLIGKDSWFSIPINLFLMADSKVRFAAATDNGVRPKMQSVYFTHVNGSVDIVATDGHKLAKLVVKTEGQLSDFELLVKAESIKKISSALSILSSAEGNVEICATLDKMYLRKGDFLASANLIDSKYINYNKIIPTNDINFSISCDRKELLRNLNIAGLANQTSKDSNGISNVEIKISEEVCGEGYLSIKSSKAASNKHSGDISMTQDKGKAPDNFSICVDYKYIAEVLKSYSCDNISMFFVDSNRPFIIKDSTQENYLCIVMPQQTKQN
jgi:DNA polymerase-3 subunit beta